jgi:hypothetical protein
MKMVQLPTIAEEEAAAAAATQHPTRGGMTGMLKWRASSPLWQKVGHLLIRWLLWDSRDTKLPWHLPVQNLREIFKPLYN